MSEYFNIKSKCSGVFDANVIYKYTCSADQSISYIGETSCQMFLLCGVAYHKGLDKRSAISDHLHECLPCQSSNIENNFEALKRCARGKLFSLEPMQIEQERPKLNTQIAANEKIALLTIY